MADKKQINPRRPIPNSGYDRLRTNLQANFRDDFPIIDGSFPGPDTRPSSNRGTQTSRKDDLVQDVSIGLQDHDEAIMYYFNNVIRPSVIINGNRENVPIIYGSPERWKSVQKDGFYRDKEGKIQTPLIMFKRDSVEKRRDLGNKLDANNPQLFYTFQERYTKRNRYDNFSVLQGRKPQKEIYRVVVPDFVKLSYTCTIWCDYVAQMNKLIEMINYSSDSYWGDKDRFQFNAKIDTYNNTTELSQGDNRIVKTGFGLSIQGYLVPDSLNKKLASENTQKAYTRSQVLFNSEVVTSGLDAPRTREEVRNTQRAISIKATDAGVGYQIIGNNNQIG
tara:strand:- start:367 stop:1368 length:1002 start_codon:yes stop_codon:yes gene_type:complete